MGALAASLLVAAAGLIVQGAGRDGCPSAADVSARLGVLLPGDSGAEPQGALVLDADAGALRVRLLSPQGSVREQRRLDLRGSCDELADAVATVAVAWQSSLRSDDVPPPVLSARASVSAAAQATAPKARVWNDAFELTVGVHAAAGTRWWAPGLTLGGLAPLGAGFSWALELVADWPRSEVHEQKRWSWMQLSLIASPSYRIVSDSFLFDLRAGLGSDVTINTSESLYTRESYQLIPPSVVAGLRITYPRAEYLPWFGVTFSTQMVGQLVSPVRRQFLHGERWTLGVALGATFEMERYR